MKQVPVPPTMAIDARRQVVVCKYNRTYCKQSKKIYTNNISTKGIFVIISTEYYRSILSSFSEKYSSLNQNRNINIYFGKDVQDMFTPEGVLAGNQGNTKYIKAIGNENCLAFLSCNLNFTMT